MAKKPKALERFSNRVILIGSVVGALVIIIGGLTAAGVDLPLTKESLAFRKVKLDLGVHDMRIDNLQLQQDAIRRKDALDTIESLNTLLGQFRDRDNLDDTDRSFKAKWERELLDWTERLKEMRKPPE